LRLWLTSAEFDYAAGFGLAADLGRAATPMLWDMLAAEQSNVRRRNALLGAAILAGGEAEDERLFAWLGQQKAIKEERTMAAYFTPLRPATCCAFASS